MCNTLLNDKTYPTLQSSYIANRYRGRVTFVGTKEGTQARSDSERRLEDEFHITIKYNTTLHSMI